MWEAELESAFADLGLSGKVQLATGNKPEKARRSGRHMGFGFLEFDGTDVEGLEKAVELLNGVELEGVRVLPSPHLNRVLGIELSSLTSPFCALQMRLQAEVSVNRPLSASEGR